MRKRFRDTSLACVLGAACGLVSAPSEAADDRAPIAIEAQPLDVALRLFALRTGLQVVYLAKLTRGLTTGGCDADAAPTEALTQLLTGTGLEFEFLNEHTVVIRAETRGKQQKVQLSGYPQLGQKARVPPATGLQA
ncbi:MAG: STN domain-containing protein [Gammaproteobacteria bacterium]